MGKRILAVTASAALFLATMMAARAGAATFNVTDNDSFGAALNAASSNGEADTIHLAAGAYGGTTNFQYAPPGAENQPITLLGAGAGQTVFEGSSTPLLSFYTHSFADTNVVIAIDGITVRNVPESDNSAVQIMTNQGAVAISNCSFTGNSVKYNGGAVWIQSTDGAATFTGNLFQGNHAGLGGGVYLNSNNSGAVTLTGNTFSGNSADKGGGAYLVARGPVTASGNTFTGNTATITGGGLHAISYSTLSSGLLARNRFVDNSAAGDGGGAYVWLYGVTAYDNVFAHNESTGGAGGGAWFDTYDTTFKFINNTLVANHAAGTGGGFHLDHGTPSVHNGIFWQNTADSWGDDFALDSGTPGGKVYNNDVVDYGCADGCANDANITADPLFTAATDPDPALWDLSLLPASPCVNAGSSAAPSLPAVDITGGPRTVGLAPDMGAFESRTVFFDDFSDSVWSTGVWDQELGTWSFVTLPASGNGVVRTVVKGYCVALVKDLVQNEARVSVRIKLGKSTAQPYASVIFDALSDAAYREAKIFRTSSGVWKLALLQKGAYDGGTGGVKASRKLGTFKATSWHTLSLDIRGDGTVSAQVDGGKPLTADFGDNGGGAIGLRSVKTVTTFDDVLITAP